MAFRPGTALPQSQWDELIRQGLAETEEYEAGHLRGARSAPGGQLVQETDSFVATWGARIVLVDDNAVRATMTASWLRQMGRDEVAVLTASPADGDWVSGPRQARVLGLEGLAVPTIEPARILSPPSW